MLTQHQLRSATSATATAAFAVAAAACLFAPADASAQHAPALPPPSQPSTVEELRRLEQKGKPAVAPEDTVKNDLAKPADAKPADADAGPTVTLREVKFSASRVFSADELAAFAKPVTDTPVTLGRLRVFAAGINAEYAKRGYPISIANIPPQKLKDGILEVQLIEPTIGTLSLVGEEVRTKPAPAPAAQPAAASDAPASPAPAAKPVAPKRAPYRGGLSPDFVLSRLPLAPNDLVHIPTIENAFIRYNRINRSAVIAELAPGSEFATTDILTRVVEPPRSEFLAYGDNAGRKNTGLYRGTAMIRGNTWFTDADSATIASVCSEGTRTAYGSYELPLPFIGGDTRIGVSYSYGETDVINGPYSALNMTGVSHSGSGYISRPLFVGTNYIVRASLAGTYYNSSTDFVNVLTDKEETCGATLSLDGELSDSTGRWFGSVDFRGGYAWLGARSGVSDPREGEFGKITTQFGRVQNITSWLSLVGTIGGQGALTDRLASSEQIQLGGMSSVRGYPEGALLGDHGYYARGEAWFRLAPLVGQGGGFFGEFARSFSFMAFADHSGAFPWKGNNTAPEWTDFFTSVGGGVVFNFRDLLTAQFIYAHPLGNVPNGSTEQNYLFRIGCRFAW